jgi:phospholipase C
MGYYNASDLPYYYFLAKYFTLCTNFFCSLLGPTNPNRVAMVAGTAGGNTTNNIANGSLTFPSLFDLLDAHGVTWKVYNGFLAIAEGFNSAAYFQKWVNDPRANLDDNVYFTDCQNGTLPQVAFIAPNIFYCEHPPAPITWGAYYINQRLHALTTSRQWPGAAFILTYDEGGGFFDHVTPPVLDAYGPGIRIPTTVVSPYTLGGKLSPGVYDHSSILKLIETVFGLPTLASLNHQFDTSTPGGPNNQAANGQPTGPAAPPRDGNPAIGNLIDVFNFSLPPRAAPPLPAVPAPRNVPRDPAAARRFAEALRRA